MVILGLGLLAVIAAAFTASIRSHIQGAANTVSNAKAEALADAGVQIAIGKLISLRRSPPPTGSPWPTGPLVVCTVRDLGSIYVGSRMRRAKFDLNYADDRLLGSIFRGLGTTAQEASGYVDRIVDFRDSDELRRPQSAEWPEYRSATLGYGPKNSLFESREELDQVLGLSESLRKRLQPFITVHSRREGIDPSRASEELLQAIVGVSGTLDAKAPTAISDAQITAPRNRIVVPQEFVSPSSFRAFRILSEGTTLQGSQFVREAIAEFDNETLHRYGVRSWRRLDGEFKRRANAASEQQAAPVPTCGT